MKSARSNRASRSWMPINAALITRNWTRYRAQTLTHFAGKIMTFRRSKGHLWELRQFKMGAIWWWTTTNSLVWTQHQKNRKAPPMRSIEEPSKNCAASAIFWRPMTHRSHRKTVVHYRKTPQESYSLLLILTKCYSNSKGGEVMRFVQIATAKLILSFEVQKLYERSESHLSCILSEILKPKLVQSKTHKKMISGKNYSECASSKQKISLLVVSLCRNPRL